MPNNNIPIGHITTWIRRYLLRGQIRIGHAWSCYLGQWLSSLSPGFWFISTIHVEITEKLRTKCLHETLTDLYYYRTLKIQYILHRWRFHLCIIILMLLDGIESWVVFAKRQQSLKTALRFSSLDVDLNMALFFWPCFQSIDSSTFLLWPYM